MIATARRTRRMIAIGAAIATLLALALGIQSRPASASPAPSPTPTGSSPTGSPSPQPTGSPSATPSTTPRGSDQPSRPVQPAECVTNPNGKLTNCHKHVPASKMPKGSTNHTKLSPSAGDLAALVDTRTWTTGGGNTFPGAEAPFGMVQWSPDTEHRSAGGGYSYGDTQLSGYSLTHVSGPGCGAGGDVPILPMTGALPDGDPNTLMTSFTNDGEIAQAGYYAAASNQPNTITSEFTATPHSSMGRFTFPATTQAQFLVKLMDSQNGDFGDGATVVGDNEITGYDTSGHFCGEVNNDGQQQEYTLHFDVVFDHAFTASKVITESGQSDPAAVLLTFDTTTDHVIQAKVGVSYVSVGNAKANWQSENPDWDFDKVRSADQHVWDGLLSRIQVSGGTYAKTQQLYSLMYKDLVQPNISSDVNGQYVGADLKVHTIGAGQHDQYGIYSGWDTYHSLAELQAILDPAAASDQAQSLVNYYAQDKLLQQWGYLNLNNYVMVGDPAQSIIADYYAFGARDFDTTAALKDMLAQATTVNDVRPGEALEQQYGYLPEDGSYSCCNAHGQVSTLLEYDSEDLALAQFAGALGDAKDATMLEKRANNWENVFNPANGLLTPRNADGRFVSGITPTTTAHYVEGDAYEYLWNVPNNYPALFSLLGGKDKAAAMLREFLSQPNGFGRYAQQTNEFGFGEQYALDYAGDPAGTQKAVNDIRTSMYPAGPSLDNNDDLGANSSTFIWEMLGMYPENSGTDTLVFNGPGFPHAVLSLPNGHRITINAPGASPTRFYVQNLKINGRPYHKLWVPFSQLARGATLDWTLGTTPSDWGSAPQDAPPSFGLGTEPAVGYLSSPQVTVAPGGTATVQLGAQNATESPQTIQGPVSAPAGLTISPGQARIRIAPDGSGKLTLHVHADASATQTFYRVPITLTASDPHRRGATDLNGLTLLVLVAPPGSLLSTFADTGVSDDSNPGGANFDGGGWSYSAQALDAAGADPGHALSVGDLSYTWPLPAPGLPDNVVAAGQRVDVGAPAGTQQIGFLGSATNGPSEGIVTLHYADGSQERYWLGLSDWTLNANRSDPSYSNQIALKTAYRNCAGCAGGRDTVNTYVFSAAIPVDGGKTLTAVTLPAGASSGELHIFAIATATTALSGPAIGSLSPNPAAAGDQVTIHGAGFGDSRGNGYVAFSDQGVNWGAPGNSASFTVDSWSDTQVTFTVPTPSGASGQWRVWPGTDASVTVATDGGQQSASSVLQIRPTANPSDYYDNTGISSDADQSCANMDGVGYSMSAEALAAAGLARAGNVTAGGVAFTWPDVAPCEPDNILAAGQTVLLHAAAGVSQVGFLGTSTNGSSSGTVTVTYSDGSTDTAPLAFSDWASSATAPEITAASLPYRNSTGGSSQQLVVSVFEVGVPVDPAKTVASVTLPDVGYQVGSGLTGMHIFAIGTAS